jgi:hypothetical protein
MTESSSTYTLTSQQAHLDFVRVLLEIGPCRERINKELFKTSHHLVSTHERDDFMQHVILSCLGVLPPFWTKGTAS